MRIIASNAECHTCKPARIMPQHARGVTTPGHQVRGVPVGHRSHTGPRWSCERTGPGGHHGHRDLLRRARVGASGGVTVPGAGHLLNLDAPDRFNESLLAFLSR